MSLDKFIQPLVAFSLLCLVLFFSLLVLSPFFTMILWSIIIVSATWDLFKKTSKHCNGNNVVSGAIITGILLIVVLIPLSYGLLEGGRQSVNLFHVVREYVLTNSLPGLPKWILTAPYIGEWIGQKWVLFQEHSIEIPATVKAGLLPSAKTAVNLTEGLISGVVKLIGSLLISFFIFANSDSLSKALSSFIKKTSLKNGEHLLTIAHKTIQGVVNGFIGAALVQGFLTGFAFAISGVPHAVFLGLLTCVFSLIPGFSLLIALPGVMWLFQHGMTGWSVFVIIWIILVVSPIEHLIKTIAIGRNSPLPLIIILMGVMGGAVTMGLIGVFVGPTILALVWVLLREWFDFSIESPLIKSDLKEVD